MRRALLFSMSCRDCAGPSPCSMSTRDVHAHQVAAHMSASVQDPFVALSAEQLWQVLPAPQLSAFYRRQVDPAAMHSLASCMMSRACALCMSLPMLYIGQKQLPTRRTLHEPQQASIMLHV